LTYETNLLLTVSGLNLGTFTDYFILDRELIP